MLSQQFRKATALSALVFCTIIAESTSSDKDRAQKRWNQTILSSFANLPIGWNADGTVSLQVQPTRQTRRQWKRGNIQPDSHKYRDEQFNHRHKGVQCHYSQTYGHHDQAPEKGKSVDQHEMLSCGDQREYSQSAVTGSVTNGTNLDAMDTTESEQQNVTNDPKASSWKEPVLIGSLLVFILGGAGRLTWTAPFDIGATNVVSLGIVSLLFIFYVAWRAPKGAFYGCLMVSVGSGLIVGGLVNGVNGIIAACSAKSAEKLLQVPYIHWCVILLLAGVMVVLIGGYLLGMCKNENP